MLVLFFWKDKESYFWGQEQCGEMLGPNLPWNAEAQVCAGGSDKDACQVMKTKVIDKNRPTKYFNCSSNRVIPVDPCFAILPRELQSWLELSVGE